MNQRIALTKKLLKNSLTEMLQTHSIYQISIRELCQKAGINRSTFYKYYGSQFDLLAEMESDLLRSVETVLASQTDPSENLVMQIMCYLEQDIEFVRLLLNSNVDPQFPEKLFSLEPIRRMGMEPKADLKEDEYEYFSCFIMQGCRQCQGVHGRLQVAEFFLGGHAELLFLVDDKQSQVLEFESGAQHFVGADQNVYLSFLQPFLDVGDFLGGP